MIRDQAKLASLLADLRRALERLDELGYTVGAAHLAAAINALEHDILPSTIDAPAISAREYAAALRDAVGDRAEEITRQQIKLATGDALRSWSEILGYLQLSR